MTALSDIVAIDEPAFYDVRNAPVLARLRAEAPVYYHEQSSAWVLSKYDDIKFAERTPELFTAQNGTLLNDARFGRNIEAGFFEAEAELISTLDPPRHGEIRRTIAAAFTPRAIARLETVVRKLAGSLLDTVRPGDSFDFVERIARVIPTQAVAQLLGIPADEVDTERILYWADELFKVGAPLSASELTTAAANVQEMKAFLLDLFGRKQQEPGEDLMSALAAAQLNHAALSEANIVMLAELVLTAGIDTTRNTMSATMWSLARHPAQLERLVLAPALAGQAVEEVLRWITPVPGFTRCAVRDTELRGQVIRQGQYVYMLYFAGNRDEEHWAEADEFDVARPPEPGVLSFGFGQHVCIGAALARMEVRVVLEEVLRRFTRVELAGTPVRVPSVMQHGWTLLPVRLG
jgi:cytochrome P450